MNQADLQSIQAAFYGLHLLTSATLFATLAHVIGMTITSVYCAVNCPREDRVTWVIVSIAAPFGWIAYWIWAPSSVTEGTAQPIPEPVPGVPPEKATALRVMEALKKPR